MKEVFNIDDYYSIRAPLTDLFNIEYGRTQEFVWVSHQRVKIKLHLRQLDEVAPVQILGDHVENFLWNWLVHVHDGGEKW